MAKTTATKNQGVTGFFYGILHYQDAIVRRIHGSFKDLKHKDLLDGGGTSPRAGAAKEAREEGEIQQQERRKSSRNEQEAPPMIPLQENLASSIILADVQKVTSAPECEENGLDVVNELLGDENNDVENDVMELDEERVHGMGNDEGSGDGFQNLSDGEVEVNSDQATEVVNLADGDVVNDLPEENDPVVGEADKKRWCAKVCLSQLLLQGALQRHEWSRPLWPLVNIRLLNLQPVKERELNSRRKGVLQTPNQLLPNLRSFYGSTSNGGVMQARGAFQCFLFIWHNKLYEHLC
ncbi:unnamed protein product [Brassica oleracea]